eukprot:591245-Prymnesium_polylepis.1
MGHRPSCVPVVSKIHKTKFTNSPPPTHSKLINITACMHFSRGSRGSLVASMSSINQAMASGVMPLHIACLKGHTEVAAM